MKKSALTIMSALAGAAVGAGAVGKDALKRIDSIQNMSSKYFELFKMMTQWVKVKQDNKNLSEYFEANGFKRIAIYGMSYAGETLVNELRGTKTEIAYGIDKNAENMYRDFDVFSPDDKLEEVDAVVVTAITFYEEIEENLSKKLKCPIISLEDILY